MITYFQAILLGLLQGVTELFPISSLGHSVVIAWLFDWNNVLAGEAADRDPFFLSFLVVLHVATALALLFFYRSTWWRIIKGFFGSIHKRRIDTPDAHLAWLLVFATVPIAVIGFIFEGMLRSQFTKPLSAIIFLMINGFILLAGDQYQRRHAHKRKQHGLDTTTQEVSKQLTLWRAGLIGFAQSGALFAGISRSGITMVAGLFSGLNNEDTARFTFLLATPIILGAGIVKIPEFFTYVDTSLIGEILAGGVAAAIGAYFSVKFLDKYFQSKSLRPFAIYCIAASGLMLLLGVWRGHF